MITSHEQAELERLRAENAALRGLLPDLPPRPPDGTASNGSLPRYGLRWNGPGQPVSVPMDDGYWTPWHIAQAENAALRDLTDAAIDSAVQAWFCTSVDTDGMLTDAREDQFRRRMRAAIDAAMREQALQALADIAQGNGMGYEK